jgi:DNA-binding NarL/FixJ family response regulator
MDGEVKTAVVAGDAIVRSWLALSLQNSEFVVAAEASSGAVARSVASGDFDLWLIDHTLPDEPGAVLIRDLRHAGAGAPAVLMSATPVPGLNATVRQAGGQGTLLKTGRRADLLATLREVARGRTWFDSRHPAHPRDRGVLTPREREVLALVGDGATNRDIAQTLGIGSETVKTLLRRSFVKLGANRRAQAVVAAHERGLL